MIFTFSLHSLPFCLLTQGPEQCVRARSRTLLLASFQPYGCISDGRQDVDGAEPPERVHRLQRPAERLVENITNPGSAAPGRKKNAVM